MDALGIALRPTQQVSDEVGNLAQREFYSFLLEYVVVCVVCGFRECDAVVQL